MYGSAATLTILFMHMCSEHFPVLVSLEFALKHPPLTGFLNELDHTLEQSNAHRPREVCQISKLGVAKAS